MNGGDQYVRDLVAGAASRVAFWTSFVRTAGVRRMAEIGVWKGDFAGEVLRECDAVEKYFMIDAWRHLSDWNKPMNRSDRQFDEVMQEAIDRTAFAAARREVLRGTTIEVIDRIGDGALDFAYIDGDHTLKGVITDLVRVYPKVRVGGWIGGDDFSRTIWQHSPRYEPTFVFPVAVHFAEAMGDRIFGLPNQQFLIERVESDAPDFIDLVGTYGDRSIRSQLKPPRVLGSYLRWGVGAARRLAGRLLPDAASGKR